MSLYFGGIGHFKIYGKPSGPWGGERLTLNGYSYDITFTTPFNRDKWIRIGCHSL